MNKIVEGLKELSPDSFAKFLDTYREVYDTQKVADIEYTLFAYSCDIYLAITKQPPCARDLFNYVKSRNWNAGHAAMFKEFREAIANMETLLRCADVGERVIEAVKGVEDWYI